MSTVRTDNIQTTDNSTTIPVSELATKNDVNQRTIHVGSVAELLDIAAPVDGQRYEVTGFYADTETGGAAYVWKADEPKSGHTGGSVLSNTVPWSGDAATVPDFLEGVGETDPSGTGAFVLLGDKSLANFGVSPDLSDNKDILNTALKVISEKGVKSVNWDFDETVNTSDTIYIRSNTEIFWTGSGFLTLTQKSTVGGVLACGALTEQQSNIILHGPKVDGGTWGYPTNDTTGENGVSGVNVTNVKVYNGIAKNCRCGNLRPIGTGGKGVQFESKVSDILVDGFTSIDCTVGFETGGYENHTSEVHYTNLYAVRCERLLNCTQANAPVLYGSDVIQATMNNIVAINCGREIPAGTELDYGLILLDRFSNAVIDGVTIVNDPTYGIVDAVVKGARGHNNRITNVRFYGDCNVLVSHTFPPYFNTQGNLQNNLYQIEHFGTCVNAIDAVAGDSANLISSRYDLSTDTVTDGLIAAPAQLSTIFCHFKKVDGSKTIEGAANTIGLFFGNTYPAQANALSSGLRVGRLDMYSGGAGDTVDSIGVDMVLSRSGSQRVILTSRGAALKGLPTYADNAAAIAGGLSVGDLYKTASGGLNIVV